MKIYVFSSHKDLIQLKSCRFNLELIEEEEEEEIMEVSDTMDEIKVHKEKPYLNSDKQSFGLTSKV